MIYITGDLHGDVDIHKLSSSRFPEGNSLTRNDYLIVCGDFGLLWDGSPEERYWLHWLDKKPWTTLWIDGNHENFDMLEDYDVVEWHGARVQYITGNIIHICRGSVFDLEGVRFFAFGGAESHDKEIRTPGKSWWTDEMPSGAEMELGRKALDDADWSVDVVITHTIPGRIQEAVFGEDYPCNQLNDYFDEISERLDYSYWFSGHYHSSTILDDKHILIYNAIVKLTDEGYMVVCDDERHSQLPDDAEETENYIEDNEG